MVGDAWIAHLASRLRCAIHADELREANRRLLAEAAERQRVAAELRRSSAFLETVLNAIQDGICVLGPDMTIIKVNQAMGVLAAGCRALVLPFDQNREQRLRATRLGSLGRLGLLGPDDLAPEPLAIRLCAALDAPPPPPGGLALDGAARTARILRQLVTGDGSVSGGGPGA